MGRPHLRRRPRDRRQGDRHRRSGGGCPAQGRARPRADGAGGRRPGSVGRTGSADEVAAAEEIIDAFEQAEREGRGVVTVNGRMIENLHVDQARRTLAQAEAIAELAGP